jgi:hypothetical protein
MCSRLRAGCAIEGTNCDRDFAGRDVASSERGFHGEAFDRRDVMRVGRRLRSGSAGTEGQRWSARSARAEGRSRTRWSARTPGTARSARSVRTRGGHPRPAIELRRHDVHGRVRIQRSARHRLLRAEPASSQLSHRAIRLVRRCAERVQQSVGRGLCLLVNSLERALEAAALCWV